MSQAVPQNILEKRDRYYRRNYIAMMVEGFCVSFSFTIFSNSTVLPAYISNISDNAMYISLLALLFFALSNASMLFSCVLGYNTKSAKWMMVGVCFIQRIGQLLILLTTWALTGSTALALLLFFLSYALYSASQGTAMPVFTGMISSLITKNIAGFFGSYAFMGALGGLLSAQALRMLLPAASFPFNYRAVFTYGLAAALFSTLLGAVFVKEVRDPTPREKMRFSQLPGAFMDISRTNHAYRHFLINRLCFAAAEMAIPFYIIQVGTFEHSNEAFIGAMSMMLLAGNAIFSKILGYIGDRSGPLFLLRIGGFAGIAASLLAVIMPSQGWGYLLFLLVSCAISSVSLSTSVANISFSSKGYAPVYTAMTGLVIAPIYAIFAFFGGVLAEKLSLAALFLVSLLVYGLALTVNYFMSAKKTQTTEK